MLLTDVYTLNDGHKIPVVGFGTWQTPDGEVAEEAVLTALEAGYRHIDTAAIYGNEESVGRAIAKSGIAREELFITTKLWNDRVTYDEAAQAIDESLAKLGLDYLDLYLIHWPNGVKSRPEHAKRNQAVWQAMEDAVDAGKIKSIGVSNFYERHLTPILEIARIKPSVNQIFLNPSDQQKDLVAFCKAHNIVVEAYSPLGTGDLMDVAVLKEIASRYGKTPAQIALKWSLQKGYLPLPKSVTASRIVENAQLFDFDLTDRDMAELDSLEGVRSMGKNPDETDF